MPTIVDVLTDIIISHIRTITADYPSINDMTNIHFIYNPSITPDSVRSLQIAPDCSR